MTDTNKTNDSWFVPLGKSGMEAKARELWKRCMPWSWEMCETDPQYRPKQELFIKFLTEAHREGMEEAAKVTYSFGACLDDNCSHDNCRIVRAAAAAIREKTNP